MIKIFFMTIIRGWLKRFAHWLKQKSPRFYLLIKIIILHILSVKFFVKKNYEVKDSNKISFIIANNSGKMIDLRKKLGVFGISEKMCQEIIIISDPKVNFIGASNVMIKKATSLSNAISISIGSYLWFIDDREYIIPFGLFIFKNIIIKKNKDIFWGRSIISGHLQKTILDQTISDNYQKLTLPITMASGPKIISRNLASRLRLPSGSMYSYMLSATDKANSIFYIKYPILYSKKNESCYINVLFDEHRHFMNQRYYFGKNNITHKLDKVLFIVSLKGLFFNNIKKLSYEADCLLGNNIKVDIFITSVFAYIFNLQNKGGLKIIASKTTTNINKINEIDQLIVKNKYDIVNIIDNQYGLFYLPMLEKLKKRPYFFCSGFFEKKNYEKSINENRNYLETTAINILGGSKGSNKTVAAYSGFIKHNNSKFIGKITIAILSYNRKDALKKTLKSIYKNSNLPFNIIILDNGSDYDTIEFLHRFSEKHNNMTCIYEGRNLGCSGGRHKMLNMIKSDYIVTLDNDMEVDKNWLKDMVIKMNEDKKNVGVCARCVMPNGKIQFTGGSIQTDESGFVLFNANDYWKDSNELSTLEEYSCDWLPGGASMWRGDISNIAQHSLDYINAFEDFDYSIQIKDKGYKIVNCPYVTLIHYHSSGLSDKQKSIETKYINDRNNMNGFISSLCAFYLRTGMIMKHELIFKFANIPDDATPDIAKEIICSLANNIK